MPLPRLRYRFGKVLSTKEWILTRLGLGAAAGTIWFLVYNRHTLTEGGFVLRGDPFYLSENKRLSDWYFHMVGQTPKYVHTYQSQVVLPAAMRELSDDAVLTEVCRYMISSWPLWYERYSRGKQNPSDQIATEEVMRSRFKAPTDPTPISEEQYAVATKRVLATFPPGIPEVPAEDMRSLVEKVIREGRGENGECVAGYFVHRREGSVERGAVSKFGGAVADDIGARHAVLAPDPWEGSCWVISVTPLKTFCVVRMHVAVSEESGRAPAEDSRGTIWRILDRMRAKLICTATCRALEYGWSSGTPHHYTAPPFVSRSEQSAAALTA